MKQRPDGDIEIDEKFWEEDFHIPTCSKCNGVLKPDVRQFCHYHCQLSHCHCHCQCQCQYQYHKILKVLMCVCFEGGIFW